MALETSLSANPIRVAVNFISKYFKWLFIIAFLGAIYGFIMASFNKKEYSGGVRFVLEDGSGGGGLSSLIGMAAQFGLDFNMKGSSAAFSGDNVLELLKSRMLIEKTLLNTINYKGIQTTLAEEYIKVGEFNKNWKKKGIDIHFLPGSNRENFTRMQDSIMKEMFEDIVKKRLNVVKPDKKLSFISVDMKCSDEYFVCIFTQALVKEVTDFYVATKTKLLTQNIGKLNNTADSILALLNNTTYKVAQQQEGVININPLLKVPNVSIEISQRNKFVLQTIYGEVVKNLELAKITLAQETPLVQIIDKPIMPLKEHGRGRIKGALTWGFIGGLFGLIFFIINAVRKTVTPKNKLSPA